MMLLYKPISNFDHKPGIEILAQAKKFLAQACPKLPEQIDSQYTPIIDKVFGYLRKKNKN